MGDIRFDGRVAIVTGAGGGIGEQHALLLAARGASVVVNDIGAAPDGSGVAAEPARRVVDRIRARGGNAVVDGNTVASVDGAAAIVQTALDTYGRLDIVVNNAGILRDKSFVKMTPDFWQPVIDVHLNGAFNVLHAAWSHLRDQSYGRIVNTTSASGIFGNFGQSNYAAAKTGLIGLTRVLALEGERYGIKVNAVSPVALTRMTDGLMGDLADRVDPALVSPVVAWLAHEQCPVSGQIFSAGGGSVAKVILGVTPGYTCEALSIENVRDHWDAICAEDGYATPESASAENTLLLS